MDCYFHDHVPSVTRCVGCRQAICAVCRDAEGHCPSCRLGERVEAARASRGRIGGNVGYKDSFRQRGFAFGSQTVSAPAAVGTLEVSPETRTLLALGYPLWPLAAIALLDPKRSPFVRRHAIQSLGFNFGVFALWMLLAIVAHIPFLGVSAWPMLFVLFPLALIADVVYGFRLYSGDNVRVPLIADWLDERDRHTSTA